MDTDKTLFIDLETTGINFAKDRIVQIGAVYPGGEQVDILVNPGMPIPKESTEIHGITDEMVKDAPRLEELADALIDVLNRSDYFVAYNFLFDFQMLQAELYRTKKHILSEHDFIFLDPYKIHRKMYPSTLSNVFEFYTGEKMQGAHNALADVLATKIVLEEQSKKYPELFSRSFEEVAEHTIGEIGVLGKWFSSKNGNIIFRQGKHKTELVGPEHENYMRWILGLDDTTISEKRYINDFFGSSRAALA